MNLKVEKAINEQINMELYSAYLYLSMATYFDGLDLTGFSHWMKIQVQEEMKHVMKFYHFVYERGGKVTLKTINQPPIQFKSPLMATKAVMTHEKGVTALIHKLYELSQKEKDYAFESFLKWFIDEQVEEEDNARKLVDKVILVGDKGSGLYLLDRELAKRKEG